MRKSVFVILTVILLVGGYFVIRYHSVNSVNEVQAHNNENLSQQKIEDLAVLCKVWGLMKYYSPDLSQSRIDWDSVAVHEIKSIIKGSSTVDNIVKRMVDFQRPETLNSIDTNVKSKDVFLSPDFNWVYKGQLKKEARIKIEAIINQKPNCKNRYYKFFKNSDLYQFTNENSDKWGNFPPAEVRVLALFRYWNSINYFFPYRELIDLSWGTILPKYIPLFYQAKSEVEYKKAVLRLITEIQDSHSFFTEYGSQKIDSLFGITQPPIELSFVDNKMIVTGYYGNEDSLKTIIPMGSIIISINGKPIQERIDELRPFVGGSNMAAKMRDIASLVLRTNSNNIILGISINGNAKKVKMLTYYIYKMPKDLKTDQKAFKMLKKGIGYIQISNINEDSLDPIKNQLNRINKLIIDMRGYPYGINLEDFGNLFLPKPSEFVAFTLVDSCRPGFFNWRRGSDYILGGQSKNVYKGQIIILINEYTQSAAEFYTMALEKIPNVVTIGSNTAGADGNVIKIHLPGNISASYSAIGIYYPDGKQTQRIGLSPQIKKSPTIKGYQNEIDEVLEEAIRYYDNMDR